MHAIFENISEKDKELAIEDLIHDSTPRPSFFFLVILSVLMATLGLLINNSAVIIGSMLIAPILSPILSLSLGVVMSDGKLISRSFYTLLKAVGMGIGAAAIITVLLWQIGTQSDFMNAEIASRTDTNLFVVYFFIAVVAGAATTFARVKPELNEALPGTAIAVALVPPIAVTGIGIASLDLSMATSAFILFLINAFGIVLTAALMFNLMNLYTKRRVATETIQEEDAKFEKEKKQAEKKTK